MGQQYAWLIASNGYPELSPTALRLFLYMGSKCLDYDNPEKWELEGLYYGGWKALGYPLTHKVYERGDTLPPSLEQRITRGMRELRTANLIVDVPREIARRHPRNRVYRLNPSGESGYWE
jgi:hypothetical protein